MGQIEICLYIVLTGVETVHWGAVASKTTSWTPPALSKGLLVTVALAQRLMLNSAHTVCGRLQRGFGDRSGNGSGLLVFGGNTKLLFMCRRRLAEVCQGLVEGQTGVLSVGKECEKPHT